MSRVGLKSHGFSAAGLAGRTVDQLQDHFMLGSLPLRMPLLDVAPF